MKQLNILFSALFCLLLFQSTAQEGRYLQEVFTDVNVSTGNAYAVNHTVLFFGTLGQAVPQQLTFDFYEPAGDPAAERALVIYSHTGSFLPKKINLTTSGSKTDSATVEMASRLARMGYVVAIPEYRLGWNPNAPTQPERAESIINAAYRGIQDMRTCIRFFKDNHANGNSFKTDTSRIVMWGQGTGGYLSLGAATLDEYTEIVQTTNPAGKFLKDVGGGTLIPMVIESVHGNINGTNLAGIPDMSGNIIDTLCQPNHVGYSSDFQLCVNLGGALADISFLEADEIPIISFASPTDPFAPYDDAVLTVPGTLDPIVQVQGSFAVQTKANQLGINQVFEGIDDEWTTGAKNASTVAGHAYLEGLYPFNLATNSFGQEEGSPWDWWEKTVWDTVPHPSCPVGPPTCSFHTISLLNNENMSATQARTYIDTIMGYFAPRAYAALNLAAVSTEEVLTEADVQITVAPNPATTYVNLRTEDQMILDVQLFNIDGKLVRTAQNVNSNSYDLDRGDLSPGFYLVKLRFEEGVAARKLLFQ